MAHERRDVSLIAQPPAAVVIVEIVAAVAEDAAHANLRDGRRIVAGQILSDRVEAQEIAFGIGEREALTPAFGRLIVESNARRDAAAFSALIGVGKERGGRSQRAESGIFASR